MTTGRATRVVLIGIVALLALAAPAVAADDPAFPDPTDPGFGGTGVDSGGGGLGAVFGFFFLLVLVLGIGGAMWRVSTARRMAREAGLNESDAARMALMSDDGLGATYLASSLRRPQPGTPAPTPTPDAAERLTRLAALRDQGLITPEEYDARRAAVIAEL